MSISQVSAVKETEVTFFSQRGEIAGRTNKLHPNVCFSNVHNTSYLNLGCMEQMNSVILGVFP